MQFSFEMSDAVERVLVDDSGMGLCSTGTVCGGGGKGVCRMIYLNPPLRFTSTACPIWRDSRARVNADMCRSALVRGGSVVCTVCCDHVTSYVLRDSGVRGECRHLL
jgi:hypothetical protein